MYYRGAHVEFCEVADDLLGIDDPLAAIAPFTAGPRAQHISLTDDHAIRQLQTFLYRANANAVAMSGPVFGPVFGPMFRIAIDMLCFDLVFAQEFVEYLAPACRLSNEKHGFVMLCDELLQQVCRCLSLGVHAQVWQWL